MRLHVTGDAREWVEATRNTLGVAFDATESTLYNNGAGVVLVGFADAATPIDQADLVRMSLGPGRHGWLKTLHTELTYHPDPVRVFLYAESGPLDVFFEVPG